MAAQALEPIVSKEYVQVQSQDMREAGRPHLATVVHAAERGQVIVGLQGADTDRTVVWARGGSLSLGHTQSSRQQQWLRVITVALQQLFGAPVRMSQKMLSHVWL